MVIAIFQTTGTYQQNFELLGGLSSLKEKIKKVPIKFLTKRGQEYKEGSVYVKHNGTKAEIWGESSGLPAKRDGYKHCNNGDKNALVVFVGQKWFDLFKFILKLF